MNEGPRALARFIGDPGEASIDNLARGGAAIAQIIGQSGKRRNVQHLRVL